MFANCSTLHSAYNYASAHKLFTSTPSAKSKRRGPSIWSDNQRPLGDNRQWHYRIEQGPDASYYDVCLYRTTMARYHMPSEDGSYVQQYTSHNSATSSQFMWNVLHIGKVLEYLTTDGRKVKVPLGTSELSTSLHLMPGDVLDVSKSRHAQAYRVVMSDEFKCWRKAVKDELTILCELFELFELRLSEIDFFEYNSYKYKHPGKPFRGIADKAKLLRNITNAGFDWTNRSITEKSAEAMRELFEACAEFLMARKDYKDDTTPLDPKAVTRSFLNALSVLYPAWPARTTEPIEMFPEKLPRNFTFYKR